MKNAEQTDILTRAVSTDVLTNSVFLFLYFFKICILAETTIKIGGGFIPKNKTQKHVVLKAGPRLC